MSDDTQSAPAAAELSPEDAKARRDAADAAMAASGMQVQSVQDDQAVAAIKTEQPEKPNPGPTTPGLATPMHREPSRDEVLQRMAPDPGRGGTRTILTTTPIIGPVEGNIPMPDTGSLIAYPWPQMGVSDSFMVGHGVSVDMLQMAADEWAETTAPGIKFSVHQMGDGVRVWRVA